MECRLIRQRLYELTVYYVAVVWILGYVIAGHVRLRARGPIFEWRVRIKTRSAMKVRKGWRYGVTTNMAAPVAGRTGSVPRAYCVVPARTMFVNKRPVKVIRWRVEETKESLWHNTHNKSSLNKTELFVFFKYL